jgi:nitrate reductase alpha subunit
VYNTNRDWEDSYRQRWQFDKIVIHPRRELYRLL